jgi:glycine dehydrogenase subunit 2
MQVVLEEAAKDPELVRKAPHTTPVRRLDETRAARNLELRWKAAPDAKTS